MTRSKHPLLSAMTTSVPVFPKKKQPANQSRLDVHAARVTSIPRLRQRKNLRDANENLAGNRQSELFPLPQPLTLNRQNHRNRSIDRHALSERPTDWNVRSRTSSRKPGCDTLAPTSWILVTTTASLRHPAVARDTLLTMRKVAIPAMIAMTSIVALRLTTVDSTVVPVTDLDRAKPVVTMTVVIADQNAAADVAVVQMVQALPSPVPQIEAAMATVVATTTAIPVEIAVQRTVAISRVIAVQTMIAVQKTIVVSMIIVVSTVISIVVAMKIAAARPIAMKRETMHGVEVGSPVETTAVEATADEMTVVAGIQVARKVRIVMTPVARTVVADVARPAAAAAVVPVVEIAGDATKALSPAAVLPVATAADALVGIEECRVAAADRFSLRLKSSKARLMVSWNCIVAVTDFSATRRKIMRPKTPIRLSPVHLSKNTSSVKVCWFAVMSAMEHGIKDLVYAKWN